MQMDDIICLEFLHEFEGIFAWDLSSSFVEFESCSLIFNVSHANKYASSIVWYQFNINIYLEKRN